MLRQCHESVRQQGACVDHFMIADGHAQPEVDAWPVRHVTLPNGHADNGNTPRGVGSLLARSQGYDFITYLDADNWYHPDHLDSMIAHQRETKADVTTSFRTYHTLDGVRLDITERAEARLKHVDTSCFMLSKKAFPAMSVWAAMPRQLSTLCDRVFLGALRHGRYSLSSTRQATVAFRTQYADHYKMAKLPIPDNAKTSDEFKAAIDYLQSYTGIAECVDALGFWPYHYF